MTDKLSTKVYTEIRDDIINGRIGRREFLNEKEVGARFSVSRAPVRDALHLLCEQGFLVSYPRKGYMVNSYTKDELDKIYQIRRHLEKLCVQLAIENATDEEINSLREFTKTAAVTLNPSETNNARFHIRLAEISKNEFLVAPVRDFVNITSMCSIKSDTNLSRHDAIVDALLERDVEKAQEKLSLDIGAL